MMNDEGQDIKIVYSFAQIDFCSKYISFALLELLSTETFVLDPQCCVKCNINEQLSCIDN